MKSTMQRYAWIAIVFGLVAAAASAQSLLDNQYYKAATDLLARSNAALESGDYDAAARLAVEARESLAKSDEYVTTMTLFYRANGWLSQANDRIAYAKSIEADINYRESFDQAVADAKDARSAFDVKDYPKSIDLSKSVIAALADIKPVAAAEAPLTEPVQPPEQPAGPAPLPAYYTLQSLHPIGDCFWLIAGYPFVYGDPWKWRLLYDANKSLLKDPDNPDLIDIGVRIVIPSINGEIREGDYDPQKEYPSAVAP
jgi:nucleoid-associated protein YgaU